MKEFITKNGHRVRQFPAGNVAITSALGNLGLGSTCDIQSWAAEAAAEFFQHEKDAELGRDRDPESPDWVVYPIIANGDVRKIGVMNERDGRKFIIRENESITGASFREAAGRWFDAHPAPPPWHDAMPGEVWLITAEDEDGHTVTDVAAVVSDLSGFLTKKYRFTRDEITAGRRIYPAQDGDNDE